MISNELLCTKERTVNVFDYPSLTKVYCSTLQDDQFSLSLFTVVHFQQLLHECCSHTLLVITRLFLFLNFIIWQNDDFVIALISNLVIIIVNLVSVWSINAVVTYISDTITVTVFLVWVLSVTTIVTVVVYKVEVPVY